MSIIFVQVARSVKIEGYEAYDRYTYFGVKDVYLDGRNGGDR